VCDDLDMGSVDVRVLGREVLCYYGAEELGRSDWVLLGQDVDGILNRICSDDGAVVRFGVAVIAVSTGVTSFASAADSRSLNVTLKQAAYSCFVNGLDAGRCIVMDLVKADVVLFDT
jgi:hypothetical protein